MTLYRYIGHPDDEAAWVEIVEDVMVPIVGPVYSYCIKCDGMFPVHEDWDGHHRRGRYLLVEVGEEQG